MTRRFLRWVGHGLAVLGACFVVWRLWGHAGDVLAKSASPLVWVGVVALSVVYALTALLLAWAWWMALGGLGESRLSWRKTWRLYARTQIAKYLPGNVFHLVGRHIAAREEGVRDTVLAMVAGLEIGMVLFSAGALSLLALDHLLSFFGRLPWIAVLILLFTGALASGGALILWRERIAAKMRHWHWRRLALAQLGYGLFILMSAVLFLGACLLAGADRGTILKDWPLLIGGYACSWASGFIVPGAPGGLGIREAALVAILGATVGESTVLLAAVMFRMITTLGDGLFFFLSTVWASDVENGEARRDRKRLSTSAD